MDNLLIITGAGASHDLVVRQGPNPLVDEEFRPPLTKDLFNTDILCTSKSLISNPVANDVGYKLKLKLNSDSPEESLESSLSNIKKSKNPTIKNQFWSIHIYLHDLFDQISNKLLKTINKSSPSNYKVLIDAIIESKYKQIIWINFNYDLLADRILAQTTNSELASLEDYMNLETLEGVKIKYTKPHGSVDWYRLTGNSHYDHKNSWDNIRTGKAPLEDFENKLSGEILTLSNAKRMMNTFRNDTEELTPSFGNSFYPAISVPLGEYEYTCPEHIEKIIPDLRNTGSVLCIGFSALDLDILDLIKGYVPEVKKLGIVNGKIEDGRKTFNRIIGKCNNIKVEEKKATFDMGFSKFLERDIHSWLNE